MARSVVLHHIATGAIGNRPIVGLTEVELKTWINDFVKAGASQSLVKKLLRHIRAIWKHALRQKILVNNSTVDLRAKSKKQVCERYLCVDECQRLLSALKGEITLLSASAFSWACGPRNCLPYAAMTSLHPWRSEGRTHELAAGQSRAAQ